jgi:hypothetical protein
MPEEREEMTPEKWHAMHKASLHYEQEARRVTLALTEKWWRMVPVQDRP